MNQVDKQGSDIAVIGLAGRFPKAPSIEVFWQNLRNGVEAISFFTDDELRQAGIRIPEKEPNFVKARGLLENADKFDAEFFGINPKEAEIMDPQHRLFLECAWEALEDAGYAGKQEERLIGVYAGMSMNTYLLTNLYTRPDVVDLVGGYQIMIGNDKDYLPTRVSYKLNLRGPSVNVQTACSTSLVSVCVACEQLLNLQCDMALAGGVSVTFPQKRGYVYQEGGISSPDGHCRAFDANAKGTVSGDGVGIVLLKRLEDAIHDGDHIYAVIKGFATNNDGSCKAGYTAPSPDGQAEVIALAQGLAGVSPESIGYIVTHGTGTPLGDPIEIEGLTKAFRAGTTNKQFCAITSVKTNIGHLDAAAGIAGLINAVLAVHHREIPPNLHFRSPNPKIDFASSPFFVNTHLREWTPEADGLRRAAVSSFGIGGTNAHVIIEEAPRQEPTVPGKSSHLLVLSARSEKALDDGTARLAAHLESHHDFQMADAAYTLAVGRGEFEHRRAVVCREHSEGATALRALDPNRVVRGQGRNKPGVVFLFPGQGAQYVNMGEELYRNQRVFREQVDGCAEMLVPHLGFDLREVLYPRANKIEEASQRLTQTATAQPALFVIEYALAKLWMSWGVMPQSLIGHSIGEYTAACLAGVFTLKEGLALVAQRGSLMQRMPKGAMLAIRVSEAEAAQWIRGEICIASINSPGSTVLSGPLEAVESLSEELSRRGVPAQKLHTSHAFHSAMMDPIRTPFAQAVQRIHLRTPRIPYLSNVTGTWITPEQATDPVYWADHLRQPVRFADGLSELLKTSDIFLLEAGPGRTLTNFAKQHPGRSTTIGFAVSLPHAKAEQMDDVWTVLHAAGQMWTQGVDLDWPAFFGDEKRQRISLPTYAFEQRRHWIEPGRLVAGETQTVSVSTCSSEQPAQPSSSAPATVPLIGRELIAASLKNLFSQLSGLAVASIDSRTSFTELGFDSLFLTQVSQSLEKQFGVKIAFGQLLERYSTLELLTNQLAEMVVSEPARETEEAAAAEPAEMQQPEANRAPLTEAQREIWFAAQHGDEASCVYNESNLLYLNGSLDVDLLKESIQQVVDRHESLRTTFSPDGEFQEVKAEHCLELPLLDLAPKSEAEQKKSIEELLREDARRPFDLVKGPLLRTHLARLHPQRHALLICVHHLICDGGSLGIILNEISEVYAAGRRGVPCELPPALRYVDYARKQAALLSSPEHAAAENYWLEQFRTLPPALELPLDFARSKDASFSGGWEYRPLKTSLCRELSRVSARQKCTLFQTFLAAYYVFLHRLTGQEEVVVGVPSAERSDQGSDKLVGHCINFLPLRSRLTGSTPFVEYLSALRASFMEAFAHQNYTFGTLVQKLKLPRDRSRPPLVSATFNMVWVRCGLNFPGLEVELKPNAHSYSNFELTFNITESDGNFALDCSFQTDLLTSATVQRWMTYFETMLESIAENPEQIISRLALIPRAERDELLANWSQIENSPKQTALLHQMVEAQALRTPAGIAVSDGRRNVSFREFNELANTFGAAALEAGLQPEMAAVVCGPVSVETLAASVGILKAGGALITLSGSPSEGWNRAIISRATILIGSEQDRPHRWFSGKFLPIEQILARSSKKESPDFPVLPMASPAILVPSGTAGDLRLTGFSHGAITNVISWLQQQTRAAAGSTLQIKRAGTERFAHEIFLTWSTGGRLVIRPSAQQSEPVADAIAREQVNRVFLSEAQLLQWKNDSTNAVTQRMLREVIVHAGRAPLGEDFERLKQKLPDCSFLILYGGAETGVATGLLLNGGKFNQDRLPIGKPISNVQAFILDSELNPVPAGVPGRLFIAGESIGQPRSGNLPPGTVALPLGKAAMCNVMETGDVARYLSDGNIDLIRSSRNRTHVDDWIVDLIALEKSLVQSGEVQDAALVLREPGSEPATLTAYVQPVPGRKIQEDEIEAYLIRQLPSAALTFKVVVASELPRTATREIDYSRLSSPDPGTPAKDAFVAPQTQTQQLLADIWCDVIGIEEAGIHDNFFDLGGHSVLVTQVATRIRKLFEVEIGLRTLFERPTIAELAETIEGILMEELDELSEEEAQRMAAEVGSPGKLQ